MAPELSLALCQMEVVPGRPRENLARLERMVEAHAHEASLFLLPELWSTGPITSDTRPAAAETGGILFALEALCTSKGVYVVGTLPVERDGALYNSTFVVGPGGVEEVYRKIHLFAPMGEDRFFTPGHKGDVVAMEVGGVELMAGFITCYDLRFPELSRLLAWRGMELLMVSALWPRERLDAFTTLIRARAMESQCFVAGVNGCGPMAAWEMGGGSLLVAPDGSTLVSCGSGEEVAVGRLPLSMIREVRGRFNTALPPGNWAFSAQGKVVDLPWLVEEAARRRRAGQRMVFTNGCFDLLHAGHVAYLEEARSRGDFLVVGLNSDRSVTRLKGAARPINPAQARAAVLAGLAAVDYVVEFQEDTPLGLIEALRPDVLVKGADWPEERIVGAKEVRSWGGEVVRIPFTHRVSTTEIVNRIVRSHSSP